VKKAASLKGYAADGLEGMDLVKRFEKDEREHGLVRGSSSQSSVWLPDDMPQLKARRVGGIMVIFGTAFCWKKSIACVVRDSVNVYHVINHYKAAWMAAFMWPRWPLFFGSAAALTTHKLNEGSTATCHRRRCCALCSDKPGGP